MTPSSYKFRWDFFIAHAGRDKKAAETLYDLLSKDSRVFLDSRSLLLGDNWDLKLPEAQRNSLVTVVLISSHTEKGYYQREEIAAAIDLARTTDEHRVVPVYLSGQAAAANSVPYGLRLKHGITLSDEFVIDDLAEALVKLREQVHKPNGRKSLNRKPSRSGSTKPRWTVAVFNFENWGKAVEQDNLGQRFSELILNSLLELHLDATQMNEEPQYLPTRGFMGENVDLRKYVDLIPFIAVVGSVQNEATDKISASIRVTRLGTNREMRLLLVNEVSFRNSPDEMRKAARLTAKRIRSVVNPQQHKS